MEAARTSETLVNFYRSTRHYNPEDSHLNKAVAPNYTPAADCFVLKEITFDFRK
jgi:hypothetical protein